MKARVKLLN